MFCFHTSRKLSQQNLNFHWKWRWWNRIQASLNFFFTFKTFWKINIYLLTKISNFNFWFQHVEKTDILDEIRSVYKPFLELYPYCFAYWIRYSDIEKRHGDWDRALTILELGLKSINRSVDLWVAYLELYHKR